LSKRKARLALAFKLMSMLTSYILTLKGKLNVADIHEVRRRNLKALVAQWDGPTNLAKQIGYTGPSYVSQMVSGNRPITEKTARHIESKLELAPSWLDTVHPGAVSARPAALDATSLARIISLLTTALQEASVKMQPAKFAELVAMVYEDAQERGRIDEKFINRVIGLVK
jgi:DNA-binding transcriptional regulator YdaS (Cro superfamily)